jgi:type I restriction-modification system DNA methylase subunit/REP element-mobilizing transposase RayT
MPLFQQSVLKKYINGINKPQLQNAWQLFQRHFFNADIQQNIRNSKEEEYQEGFVRDLFVNILGYTLNPQPDYNFVLEKKTITDATKSDGAILLNKEVIGVVELKDTGTPDLDKVSNQAFGYKHKHKNCTYVVTSNFEKLRFYINDATDFEEFELFTLTQERFALLYLCLHQQNILSNIPLRIKQESLVQEENVTKKLYADYSLFKRKLFQNIAEQNPQHDKLLLFKKTQKLLDRFLFIFFAEDKSLLPPNSVREILKQWEQLKELDNYVALYDRFKKYFGYLNVGHVGKQHEIFAYNGGLFLPDEILDNIIIDDNILAEGTQTLSGYDFETDVDVNILGHIFEHSLTEIEELQAELEGKEIEKNKTKRKKDGVFYTPRYITKYIVENTVGALCIQKKEELQINEETFAPQKRKANKKALLEKIDAYRNWLLQLSICDPACGSGAFLNAALEYLKTEHRTADELTATMLNVPMVFSDIDNSILENNLFGVDINEDAIEIAKLSLWLHTAKKGRKLSNLSNNIKCGNSLIDDKTVAGEKAFVWTKEFPHVFKEKDKNGFHITTATHDSRTSERMIKFKVRENRDNGTRPEADPVWLDKDEEILITKVVSEIVTEDQLNVMAYNICGDHMHLLLVCEKEDVPQIMQKIKSKTARAVNIHRGVTIPKEQHPDVVTEQTREHAPLSKQERGETQHSLWTQKYGCKEITDEAQLWNTVEYIRTNREKHELPPLQQGSMLPCLYQNYEHVFRKEYKGGFDVVIGNPPYVRNELISESDKDFFKIAYKTFTGKSDLYVYFFEMVFKNLKPEGLCGFISSSKYTKTKYGKELIKYLNDEVSIISFIDFKDLDIFNGIVAYPSTIILKKAIPKEDWLTKLFVASVLNADKVSDNLVEYDLVPQKEVFERLGSWTNNNNESKFELFKRVKNRFKPLISRPQVGIKTGLNSAYIFDKDEIPTELKSSHFLRPYLLGKEVKRYASIVPQYKVFLPYEFINEKLVLMELSKYEKEFNFYNTLKGKLSNRAIIKEGIISGNKKWYELQQIKTDFNYSHYIVYPDISNNTNFTLVKEMYYDMTCFGMESNQLELF